MDHVYDLFLDRVASGRSLEKAQVNEVGRGRVWTGVQAQENGLVDELGGFLSAINAAKKAAGIPVDERVALSFYPQPQVVRRAARQDARHAHRQRGAAVVAADRARHRRVAVPRRQHPHADAAGHLDSLSEEPR